MNLLNKKLREDGDFRRTKERRFYKPPSVKRQESRKDAKKAFNKSLQDRVDGEFVPQTGKKKKSRKKHYESLIIKDTRIPRAGPRTDLVWMQN